MKVGIMDLDDARLASVVIAQDGDERHPEVDDRLNRLFADEVAQRMHPEATRVRIVPDR